MGVPKDEAKAREAVEALARNPGNKSAAAREIGISRQAFRERLDSAAALGMLGTKPVLPGFVITKTSAELDENEEVVRQWVQQEPAPGEEFAVPAGHVVKGVSAYVDAENRIIGQWIKTREGELDPLAIADAIKSAFSDYEHAAAPVPSPAHVSDDLLTLVPLADWHIGLFAWRGETGTNWDLKIAESVIGDGVADLVSRTPASGNAVVLGGGDLIHADNSENRTSRSGHSLDVDGRYDKVIGVASRLLVRTVDACLARHQQVTVRILKGNHDEHASVAIAYFLLGWYRNEPRVTVDVDPSLFWWMRFGRVLFGATHGHMVKIGKMPSIMAHRRAEDWGATQFRYVHGFHLHHSSKTATEGEGVICEIHQSPVAQDAWHFGSGFLSGRSLQAITYHQSFGEIGRARVAIMDAVGVPA
ncbi:helix-turn-helix domain-containing protein [Roseixanthobacter pseudopolyaromaticivorans]|uniref:helix-turn-helix domain-containing protein n=1 Tax=Xanthobacteraceae TaxID=335928 RepID=UPI00372ABB79